MILEGLVTTLDSRRRLNVAPMGPIVSRDMTTLTLRPFQSSTTYRNLKTARRGVFHVTDDSLTIARAAIGRLSGPLDVFPAETIDGLVLRSACRWYEFEVESLDDSRERTEIVARVVHRGVLREFFGFHRARHAVLEAAILATRRHLTPDEEISRQFASLKVIVEKTAGEDERAAFALLEQFLTEPPISGEPLRPPAKASPGSAVAVIRTGCRLHFGPFSVGGAGKRDFGGVGLMLRSPGVTLTVRKLQEAFPDAWVGVPSALRETFEVSLRRFRETAPFSHPVGPVVVSLDRAIDRHTGLGSGTQVALAFAKALSSLFGPTSQDAVALAKRVGRGLRSAIGIHGFALGGLLIDAGKATAEAPGTLAARIDFPDWGILLATPRQAEGLSGDAERHAFSHLPPMPSATTERLCRIALLEWLPAAREKDFAGTSAALREFGRTVGDYFAPAQGGVFAHPLLRELESELQSRGIAGVAQSSWGPTIAILLPTLGEAESLAAELGRHHRWSDCLFHATVAKNDGASAEIQAE